MKPRITVMSLSLFLRTQQPSGCEARSSWLARPPGSRTSAPSRLCPPASPQLCPHTAGFLQAEEKIRNIINLLNYKYHGMHLFGYERANTDRSIFDEGKEICISIGSRFRKELWIGHENYEVMQYTNKHPAIVPVSNEFIQWISAGLALIAVHSTNTHIP